MISVVIPTRNRSDLLNGCLDAILNNSIKPNQIIVIDSSDLNKREKVKNFSTTIEQEFTDIKSAARQRNMGLEKVSANCKYVAFLDDDVVVPENYFSKLIFSMQKYEYIGVSGLALNVERKFAPKPKSKLKQLASQFFLLDSNKGGVLLKSGVNIPIKARSAIPIEVEWLIGCSIWEFSKIKNLRFEEDFFGQSVGEDVIFSLKASKRGKIAVDPTVVLDHLESPIMRPNSQEFIYMWIRNRKRIISEMKSGHFKYLAYHWANFGKLLQIIVFRNPNKFLELKGILKAYKHNILGLYEN
jgi:glycosyltransferase involved in cell wall biosynthesis